MKLIDVISIATIALCFYGLYNWLHYLPDWPLRVGVIIAILSNFAFLVVRFSGIFSPADLNLFSAVRVLLTVLMLAVIPPSVKNRL